MSQKKRVVPKKGEKRGRVLNKKKSVVFKVMLLSSAIVLAFLYYVTSGSSASQINAKNSQIIAKQFFKAMVGGNQKDAANLLIESLRDSADTEILKFRENLKADLLGELRQLYCKEFSTKTGISFFSDSQSSAYCMLEAKFDKGSIWMKVYMIDDRSIWYVSQFEYGSYFEQGELR